MNRIEIGGEYIHSKTKKHYKVLYIGKHSETLEDVVVYQALYDDKAIWVRPKPMFLEMIKDENGNLVQRFQ